MKVKAVLRKVAFNTGPTIYTIKGVNDTIGKGEERDHVAHTSMSEAPNRSIKRKSAGLFLNDSSSSTRQYLILNHGRVHKGEIISNPSKGRSLIQEEHVKQKVKVDGAKV